MSRPWCWQKVREKVLIRDHHLCVRCGAASKSVIKIGKFIEYKSNMVVDHIIPIKLGGDPYDLNNLQSLCTWCNAKKNKWDQHFIAQQKRLKMEEWKNVSETA